MPYTQVQEDVRNLVNTMNVNQGEWRAMRVQTMDGECGVMIEHYPPSHEANKYTWVVHADGSASRPYHNPVRCANVWSIVAMWLVPLGDSRLE